MGWRIGNEGVALFVTICRSRIYKTLMVEAKAGASGASTHITIGPNRKHLATV